VPEPSGRELLHEWRKLMDSVVAAAASVTGGSDLARQLLAPMERQLELVQEVVEREGRLQRELAGQLVAPVDAVFTLLEESSATMRRQAEALGAAGRALYETAGLMKHQAEIFERTVGLLKQPAELAKSAAGLKQKPRKRAARGSRRPRAG
jgi:hypothetical protein